MHSISRPIDWFPIVLLAVFAMLIVGLLALGVYVVIEHRFGQPSDVIGVGKFVTSDPGGGSRLVVHTTEADVTVDGGFTAKYGASLEVRVDSLGYRRSLCVVGSPRNHCVAVLDGGELVMAKK